MGGCEGEALSCICLWLVKKRSLFDVDKHLGINGSFFVDVCAGTLGLYTLDGGHVSCF